MKHQTYDYGSFKVDVTQVTITKGRYDGFSGFLVSENSDIDGEISVLVDPSGVPCYSFNRELLWTAREKGLVLRVPASATDINVVHRARHTYAAQWIYRHRPTLRPLGILDTWGALLPARIANEDLGDFIEDIERRTKAGQRFTVWLRVAAAMFWTGVNALGYFYEKVGTKKAG